VYDFPDTESLRNWLSSREELGGYSLSHDGGQEFKELKEYAQIFPESMRKRVMSASADAPPPTQAGPSPRSSRPAAKTAMGMPTANAVASGSTPARKRSTSATDIKKSGQSGRMKPKPKPSQARPIRPPSRPPPTIRRSASWAIPVSGVLLVILVVFVLQLAGVVDLGALFGGSSPAPAPAPTPTPEQVVEATPEQDPGQAQGAVQPTADPIDAPSGPGANPLNSADFTRDQLEQARQEIGRREYEQAVQTLKSVQGVAPNNPEVYRMMERAYSRMGDRDAAQQARDKLKALRKSP
jgi:tetratricopeptide (TPR) repeat protein